MIKFNKDRLCAALSIASKAAGDSPTMRILGTVKFDASKTGTVTLTGTNLSVEITTSFQADVTEDASFCLPGRRMVGIFSALSADTGEIHALKKAPIRIKCGHSDYRILHFSPEDFPVFSEKLEGDGTVFKQSDLAARIHAAMPAVSKDDSRFFLKSIFIETGASETNFVATDGRRLHRWKDAGPDGAVSGIMLPGETAKLVHALLSENPDGNVFIKHSERFVCFHIEREGGSVTVTSKLVDGNYPNYRQVIPKEVYAAVRVKRSEIMAALSRASRVLDDKSTGARISTKGLMLEIFAESKSEGECNEVVACENKSEVRVEIGVKVSFLMDALQAVETEFVDLRFNPADASGRSPLMVTSDGFESVVMPMHI